MRLFLSSEGFGNYPKRLVELVGESKKVAFIDNAKDFLEPAEREAHVQEKKAEFETLGFEFQELDLRSYFHKSNKLLDLLSNFGVVWLSGGNTFVLRRALAYSGLDNILKEQVAHSKIIYGGSSAGSIIPTPSLHGTEYGDEPSEIPKGYKKEVIWSGLNLVSFHIVPHYESEWFREESDAMVDYLKKNELPHKTLKDGQVIVIDGDKKEFLQ